MFFACFRFSLKYPRVAPLGLFWEDPHVSKIGSPEHIMVATTSGLQPIANKGQLDVSSFLLTGSLCGIGNHVTELIVASCACLLPQMVEEGLFCPPSGLSALDLLRFSEGDSPSALSAFSNVLSVLSFRFFARQQKRKLRRAGAWGSALSAKRPSRVARRMGRGRVNMVSGSWDGWVGI